MFWDLRSFVNVISDDAYITIHIPICAYIIPSFSAASARSVPLQQSQWVNLSTYLRTHMGSTIIECPHCSRRLSVCFCSKQKLHTAWYPAFMSRAGLHIQKNTWLSTALRVASSIADRDHLLSPHTGRVAKAPNVKAPWSG
jgi:hypothetical protein